MVFINICLLFPLNFSLAPVNICGIRRNFGCLSIQNLLYIRLNLYILSVYGIIGNKASTYFLIITTLACNHKNCLRCRLIQYLFANSWRDCISRGLSSINCFMSSEQLNIVKNAYFIISYNSNN